MNRTVKGRFVLEYTKPLRAPFVTKNLYAPNIPVSIPGKNMLMFSRTLWTLTMYYTFFSLVPLIPNFTALILWCGLKCIHKDDQTPALLYRSRYCMDVVQKTRDNNYKHFHKFTLFSSRRYGSNPGKWTYSPCDPNYRNGIFEVQRYCHSLCMNIIS
jgi:hypothetical protein